MEGVQQGSDKQAADDGERMSEFCRELARLMRERGTGVRELARLVPCNPGHVSNLRNGKARPSPELAQILDDILGAGGALAALAAAGSRPGPVGDLQLIELARRAEASDLGVGTLELLAVSTDRLCRDYPTVDPRVLSDQARIRLGYVTNLLGKRVTLTQHRDLLVVARLAIGLARMHLL